MRLSDFDEIIGGNKKTGLIIFVSQEEEEKLLPLAKNRPPILFYVAGKRILEWIYSYAKKYQINKIALLVEKKSKEKVTAFVEKMTGEPVTAESANGVQIFEYNPEKGINRKLAQTLLDDIAFEKSLWLDGNSILSEKLFSKFLFESMKTTHTGLFTKINDENEGNEVLGMGSFDHDILETAIRGVKNTKEIITAVQSKMASAMKRVYVNEEENDFWELKYLWNLLDANQELIKDIEPKNEGVVEEGATIIGKVVIEQGARIRAGSYLEGPLVVGKKCDIGPNCYLRKGVSLGEEVRIGNACEVKNTIVFDGSHVAHLSYVGDSIVGEHCNFGAGTITGNLRLDDQTVKAEIAGEVVSTKRRKIGVIMGDNVKTAINTYFMPGVIVGNNSAIGTGVILSRNLESDKMILQVQTVEKREWKAPLKRK
jgi:bifunctional UDP-N-acetylglucosamine pyrophosphorylase/glucosamine-1-phosphate N-acetyltransferase